MRKFLFPLVFAFCIISCNNKADKKTGDKDTSGSSTSTETKKLDRDIVGMWKPTVADLPKMAEGERKNIVDSVRLEFLGDGHFNSYNGQAKKSGSYIYSEQDSKLITNGDGGDNETFTVSWEDNQLVLTNAEGVVKLRKQ